MKIPITIEQFFKVFENYNTSIFPFQIILLILGIVALILVHTKPKSKNKFIGIFLGLLSIWTGLVYNIVFFTPINKMAYLFGILFTIQGLLILANCFSKERLDFNIKKQTKDFFGEFFIIFGLIIYPLIGFFVEGSLLRTIVLGLPCPTTIMTFGFFMLTSNKFPKYLILIPSLWAIIGFSAAINFGVYQDIMLPISAIIANLYILGRKTK